MTPPLVAEPERQGLTPPVGWVVLGDEGRVAIDGPADPAPMLLELATGRTIQLRNLASP